MYALVDCNNFYVSCERLFRPDLHNKPVVVLSNNDGCSISRSNEAKALNIPMGAPAYQYSEIFKKHQVHLFSTNFSLYGDISKRVMNTLAQFTPNIEVYSIDEAFLDLSHIPTQQLEEYGATIRQAVMQQIGMPVSVGIAPTKTLAKAANYISKTFKGYNNTFAIITEERRQKVLKYMPVGKIWGIGKNHEATLQKLGAHTAFDFTQLSDALVQKQLSIVGKRLKKELEGIPCLQTEEVLAKKNIATTRTFGTNITDIQDLATAISNHAANCCTKLRKQNSAAQFVHVFLRTNRHRPDQTQYRASTTITIIAPHNSTLVIANAALQALNTLYKPGYQYKKAGVILSGITPINQVQQSLFEPVNREKHQNLMNTLDKINAKAGKNKIHLATQNNPIKKQYTQNLLSPAYTTKWQEILTINI